MATRVAPQQDRDLRSTSHKIDGLLVACMALTVLLFAIVVCAALLEIYTLPPVDDTKPRVDMCFDDFDPKTMSRNEYAHARASASCSWARSWRWFFAKLEELKGQKEL
ncbi:unnamed protein product [Durusdinium trenchii]|uniref:Uncharacterized protein n=1 Tax=Durusdinium trenchii TaxID=1381693 RepID=A0ABP0P8E3_9DINO